MGIYAIFLPPFLNQEIAILLHFLFISALTAIRFFLKSGKLESGLSFGLAVTNSIVSCSTFSYLERHEFPSWALAAAGAIILIYTFACGHDFSFVGSVFAPIFPFGILITVLHFSGIFPEFNAFLGFLCVFALLSYSSFNLAMIMKRRRADEILTSVADFQRDIINLITYPARIIHHWTKYKFKAFHE